MDLGLQEVERRDVADDSPWSNALGSTAGAVICVPRQAATVETEAVAMGAIPGRARPRWMACEMPTWRL
jgi:hypothetical protein